MGMKRRYEGVDCLRCIAIFTIVLYHIWALGGMGTYRGHMISYGGEIGVTFFLVLSGFSMYLVIDKEYKNNTFLYSNFLYKRFQKIAPQYYASLIVAILFTNAAAWFSGAGLKDIIAHLFFIHNLHPSTHGSISGVLWTMGLIVQFYLLAPIIYKAVQKKPVMLFLFSIVATILSKYFTLQLVDEQWRSIYDREIWTALDSFVLGELAARVLSQRDSKKNVFRRVILGGAAVVVTIIWIRIGQIYGIHVPTFVGCIWHTGLSLCVSVLVILWGDITLPMRIKGIIAWLTKNEYSIYVWHMLIISNLLNNAPIIGTLCRGDMFVLGVIILVTISVLWAACMTKLNDSISKGLDAYLKVIFRFVCNIRVNKYKVYAFIILCFAMLSINFGNVTSAIGRALYPEYIVNNADLASEKIWLRDFTYLEDGSIQSTSGAPWIYVDFNKNGLSQPMNLEIDIESATNENQHVLMYYVDTYQVASLEMKPGAHLIQLNLLSEDDFGLRLDLATQAGEVIKLNRIVFNNNNDVTKCFQLRALGCLVWLLILGCALIYKERKISVCTINTHQFFLRYITVLFYGVLGMFFSYHMFLGPLEQLSIWESVSFGCLLIVFAAMYIREKFDVGIWIFAYALSHGYLQYKLNDYALSCYIRNFWITPILVLNLLFVFLIVFTVYKLIGDHLGNLLCGSISLIYIVANIVKMKYQNSLIRLADLKLGREVIGIAGAYIDLRILAGGIVCLIGMLYLGIIFRHKLRNFFRPQFSRSALIMLVVGCCFVYLILSNGLKNCGIDVDKYYLTNKQQINEMGFGFYSLLEFTGNQKSNEPTGYDETLVDAVKVYKDNSTKSDVKPTVILILAESLFDVEDVPNLTFNQKLLPNLGEYKVANLLSPCYGGRTVVAEYEVVTGMSNIFIDGENSAYNSYLDKTGHSTGSLAREFSRAGYMTYAIHANGARFYSRDTAYDNMGFDKFISKEDFDVGEADRLADGIISDKAFVDKIIETLDKEENPTFILGISFEAHGPYSSKYASTDIQAYSDVYNESVLCEISIYGQAIYNFDKQMGRLIEYLEQNDQEALLYIFGDHLPSATLNNVDGYLNDIWEKYNTPLFAYSTFNDTSIKQDFLSMNQIAPEILRKSGIEYSPYYDFIYQLRDEYPVLHKELGVDLQDENINLYHRIYWDLLFGERYLLQ